METKKVGAKICLLGDGGVGKTSLIRRYVLDMFDDQYIQTLGTKITKKVIDFNLLEQDIKVQLKLMIWDVMGQATAQSLRRMYYKDSKGAMIVCDLTNKDSYRHLHDWILSLFNASGKVPVMIIGNKYDLKKHQKVSIKELEEIAEEYDTDFFLTSAKTGKNVDESFSFIGEKILYRFLKV